MFLKFAKKIENELKQNFKTKKQKLYKWGLLSSLSILKKLQK